MFVNPQKILDQLNLSSKMVGVEFGCGSGIFAIALAKKLKKGKVYGIDILEEKLEALKARAKLEKVENIETICSNIEKIGGSTLKDDFADIVLIPNVLFQNPDKETIIKEAKRITKPNGQILILDWKPNTSIGPSEGTISSKEIRKISKKVGLKFLKEIPAGVYHYCLLFKKLP